MLLMLLAGQRPAAADSATNSGSTSTTAAAPQSSTNGSDGGADVKSKDAKATGNKSDSKAGQNATVNGHNGSIQIINQSASVSNGGTASANSGGNTATGNGSTNTAGNGQSAGTGGGSGVNNNSGSASNSSNGTANIHTGDATATGNSSNTNITQTANGNASVPGGLGGILIVNQSAAVTNSGSATANTGDNVARGNVSDNTAANDQTAGGDGSIANNSGGASNSSNGNANITTGNANSTGNNSNTTTNQLANVTAGGSLGGIILVNQTATVSNSGTADANTGGNSALGNGSTNLSNTVQGAVSGAGPPEEDGLAVASNDGQANNSSDGTATIHTGNANAVGNSSTTNVTQHVNATTTGQFGGIVLVNQSANVTNSGTATANTGGNTATGNASLNVAGNSQTATSAAAEGNPSVAANFGTASNDSDGTATIHTGAANAVGNASSTSIAQGVNAHQGGDGGFAIVNQNANVVNGGGGDNRLGGGFAQANSGGNTATGNASLNIASSTQLAASPGAEDNTVPGNFGEAKNTSDGHASIHTGPANAVGSASSTSIAQGVALGGSGDGFAIVDQEADVLNTGAAFANSGLNSAVGNASQNTAASAQFGISGDGADTTVAGNFGSASNTSNGHAVIHTGPASAVGNASSTSIAQVDPTIAGSGFVIVDQDASVLNAGIGVANSGLNTAVGNASNNAAANVQFSAAGGSTDNTIAANFGSATNWSDGHANVITGAASAVGSSSTTNIAQISDAHIGGSGFVIVDQDADVLNFGVGIANSGLNAAVGNASDNTALNIQVATAAGDDEDGEGQAIASNDGIASNWSNGTAGILTGDAIAAGNVAHTTIVQVDPAIGGSGFAIVDQEADVDNFGVGIANSGLNAAVGNLSNNTAVNVQVAANGAGEDGDEDGNVIASNNGTASNNSNGTATIITGCAEATGNESHTTIAQVDDTSIGGSGFVIVDQDADVNNLGLGIANSGLNAAVGNVSDNTAVNVQIAASGDTGDGDAEGDVIASNVGSASNTSDGTAHVLTGDATAIGNLSATHIVQAAASDIDGSGFVIVDQEADVDNAGVGIANSGLNLAVGNASENAAVNVQFATATGSAEDDDNSIVASNVGSAANHSDGLATVITGCACAIGNTSVTHVAQLSDVSIDDTGFALVDQDADVENFGVAIANTGLNAAVGNASDNAALNIQVAAAAGDDDADTVVASNIGGPTNHSDGTALIHTGNAFALGNLSGTGSVQVADVDAGPFAIVNQTKTVSNFGIGVANSGLNLAAGNTSTNLAINVQLAAAAGGDDNVIANNVGTATNTSDGTALIHTGDATAFGNVSGTNAAIPPVPDFRCGCKRDKEVPPPVKPEEPEVPIEKLEKPEKPEKPEIEFEVAAEAEVEVAALPRTGASVLNVALFGLLLLLLGLSLTWKARRD